MKRMSHRSLHAPMLGRQPVKRGNGGFVGQHHGDLPPLGGVGRLTLCAGLGLGHGLANPAQLHSLIRRKSHMDGLRVSGFLTDGDISADAALADVCQAADVGVKDSRRLDDAAQKFAVTGGGGDGLHGLLRWVTVGPLNHVTSDVSMTVRRESEPVQRGLFA